MGHYFLDRRYVTQMFYGQAKTRIPVIAVVRSRIHIKFIKWLYAKNRIRILIWKEKKI